MSLLRTESRATHIALVGIPTGKCERSGGAFTPPQVSAMGLVSKGCRCLQRSFVSFSPVKAQPPPASFHSLSSTAKWRDGTAFGHNRWQRASDRSGKVEAKFGRSSPRRSPEEREFEYRGRSGGRRNDAGYGSARGPPRRFEEWSDKEATFEIREGERQNRPSSRGADGFERRQGAGRTGGRGGRVGVQRYERQEGRETEFRGGDFRQADGADRRQAFERPSKNGGRGGRANAQRYERQEGRDTEFRGQEKHEGRAMGFRGNRQSVDEASESRAEQRVKEEKREIRSWEQLRALGAPTLEAFRPKPKEVKSLEDFEQEGTASIASSSEASVLDSGGESKSASEQKSSVPSKSLLSFALADDSLDSSDDSDATSESQIQQSSSNTQLDIGQPSVRRIRKEVWRPGVGKTLQEDRSEEDWEAHKEAREKDCRLLIQNLLLLGGRDSPWDVLNALAPGLRPYDYSKIIKQLSQQDFKAGWVRALQTFLWVQAHDPSKTNNRVYTAIIDSLGRAGQLEIAITLWEDMASRGIPRDIFITNVMLSTLVRSRDYQAALELFQEVQKGGLDGSALPDVFTYGTVIDACARGSLGLDRALGLFREMIAAGIAPDIVVCNNILRACAEEGAFGEAANLIDTMKASGLSPNVVSYNILLDAFCKRKELDKAFEVFQEMKREGVPPDFVVYRTLADALRKQGFWEDAEVLYDEMNRLGLTPATVSRGRDSRSGLRKQSSVETW